MVKFTNIKILILIGNGQRKLPAMVLFFILTSLLDLVGLGLIAPYIALVINPETVNIGFLGSIMNNFGIESDWKNLIIILNDNENILIYSHLY